MQLKASVFLLAVGIGATTAQTSTTTTTDTGTTTAAIPDPTSRTTTSVDSFTTTVMNRFNLDRIGLTAHPQASIIDVNTASPDTVTYLIKCYTPSTTRSSSTSASPTGSNTTAKSSTSCNLPPEGVTLVNGPDTAGYTYTATNSGAASRIREECTIMTPSPMVSASVTCTWMADGPAVTVPMTDVDTLAPATVRSMEMLFRDVNIGDKNK
ncbi:hypothetical protein UCDDS831_g02011 [Diplodia seriata]|uniref:Uncharacterized protein n=1 Tax=Diplodia seriata TaxID=420778 RepID=A0A0G2GQN5_9PEZI|nr:hypothetical protein UCDDS831_g02011 [Diplodia seriata]